MRWFKKVTPPTPTREQLWRDEDTPLFYFGRHERDPFTIGDSFKHIFAVGASGSGKTSGSLATLSRSYLQAGYGGLVLCAKPDEAALWRNYAAQTGRTNDVVVVSTDHDMPYRFNFLNYELRRKGRGAGSTTNIVELFSKISDIIENNTKESLGEDFWHTTALDLVRFTVIVLSLCSEPLTVGSIKRFIVTAPSETQTFGSDWESRSYAGQRIQEAYRNMKTSRERGDLKAAHAYFMEDFATLNDRTRSSIAITFSSIASKFLTGDIRELFCGQETHIVPEDMWQKGKIVVLDVPVSQYGKEGLLIQSIFKYCFQQALLRRDLTAFPRPVFVAQDEYQNFMSAYDYRFLSEARSAGVAVIMATQNIANLYSILGSGARDQANSLLGNAATKIFHANTDTTTNIYASELIGQEWQKMVSRSMKNDGKDASTSISRQIHARVLPSNFQTLLQGGKKNDWWVEALIVQTGKGKWQSTGKSYHTARFKQQFE